MVFIQKTINLLQSIIKKSSSKFNPNLIFLVGDYAQVYKEKLNLKDDEISVHNKAVCSSVYWLYHERVRNAAKRTEMGPGFGLPGRPQKNP